MGVFFDITINSLLQKRPEIAALYKTKEMQVDGEYTFNTAGLVTLNTEKMTDLKIVEAATKKATYNYK